MRIEKTQVKTNHDTGFLGILACIFMIIDHLGVVFFPKLQWMRIVGRIALPLFAWGIATGAKHTRNMARYAVRLLLLLIISQPFFMFALNHQITHLNIFATLLLGLLSIWGLQEKKEWMTVIALLLSHLLSMDYGTRGVLCVLLLWALHDHPFWLSVCFSAYCVVWGETSISVWHTAYFSLRLQTTAVLALPLMLYPKAKRTQTPRWLMYAVYPGHLAIIWAVKELF